jgi:hypothetical protein
LCRSPAVSALWRCAEMKTHPHHHE